VIDGNDEYEILKNRLTNEYHIQHQDFEDPLCGRRIGNDLCEVIFSCIGENNMRVYCATSKFPPPREICGQCVGTLYRTK
jgi:hypothetical protein